MNVPSFRVAVLAQLDVNKTPTTEEQFTAWFKELQRVSKLYYRHALEDGAKEAWRSYFEAGETPKDALEEDLSNG